ncbi:hypothetical protein GQR93_12670 [Lentilactobacillus hilgardii]|uniref:Uncharacterized protein n=1 Tax=Lentilactobacillus hilgardii TaxID=1588 RepID=A0A6P1EA25_LENHI|nr:hypothetical protein [Lentilactobacillus hilgardii]MCT3398836.1 hypothetical protein [Lentilactobacillus hilgardii]QHB52980.1 hypothetical protein GQR93_12670 [Lentilactobacillus hilgardii]RRG12467.1 MAG: hypothetical protein DUD35_00125 [Lactobacillus sp.]
MTFFTRISLISYFFNHIHSKYSESRRKNHLKTIATHKNDLNHKLFCHYFFRIKLSNKATYFVILIVKEQTK